MSLQLDPNILQQPAIRKITDVAVTLDHVTEDIIGMANIEVTHEGTTVRSLGLGFLMVYQEMKTHLKEARKMLSDGEAREYDAAVRVGSAMQSLSQLQILDYLKPDGFERNEEIYQDQKKRLEQLLPGLGITNPYGDFASHVLVHHSSNSQEIEKTLKELEGITEAFSGISEDVYEMLGIDASDNEETILSLGYAVQVTRISVSDRVSDAIRLFKKSNYWEAGKHLHAAYLMLSYELPGLDDRKPSDVKRNEKAYTALAGKLENIIDRHGMRNKALEFESTAPDLYVDQNPSWLIEIHAAVTEEEINREAYRNMIQQAL